MLHTLKYTVSSLRVYEYLNKNNKSNTVPLIVIIDRDLLVSFCKFYFRKGANIMYYDSSHWKQFSIKDITMTPMELV